MSPDTKQPQSIPVTFSGTLAPEQKQRLADAVCRGVEQAVQKYVFEEVGATDAVPRERQFEVLGGDILRIGPTGVRPVLSHGRDIPHWVKAGGNLEVETGDPVRAVNWGRYLFGDRGFVVLAKPHDHTRLLVRPLATPLHTKDFGGFVSAVSREPGHVGAAATTPATGATFITDPENQPLIVSTIEGTRLYRTNAAITETAWAGANIERWLADPAHPGALDESDVRTLVQALTREHADDLSIAQLLVTLDRTLFATMSIDDRRRYLVALMRIAEQAASGVDAEQVGAAMVQLVASCRSKSELDALLAPLAADGTLLKLFSQFDKPTFSLLLAVGAHLALAPFEPELLLDAVVYQLKHPMSMLDIGELIGTGYDWLRSTVSGLADLPLLPVELAGSAGTLFELYVLLARALGQLPIPIPFLPGVPLPPDPEAQAQVRALLASAGSTGRIAMAGLGHIEKLAGTALGTGAVTSALMRRVMRVILLEILAAFVTGLPELRAAKFTEKVAAQARLLGALATAMKLAEAGEVGRLMWLLPRSYADDVLRLLEKAPVRARTLARFRAASPAAHAAGGRLLVGLDIARVIENAAGSAAGLAEDVVAGAHRIIGLVDTAPRWSGKGVRALLSGVPATEMAAVLRVAGRLTAEQLSELGPAVFGRVARAPGALEFVADAGAHALAVTARRYGSNTARYQNFLDRVAAVGKTMSRQEYHQLTQRLAAGDLAAFDDSAWLSRAAEAAEKSVRPDGRPVIPASALGDIGTIASKDGFRREVARLLRADPGHPLQFLLDESGALRSTTGDMMHWLEHPEITEAGHLTSAKSLSTVGSDQLVVMSAYRNRLASGIIEHPSRGGFMSTATALEIRGIPVDPETAVDWVSKGLLDPAEIATARRVRYQPLSEDLGHSAAAGPRIADDLVREAEAAQATGPLRVDESAGAAEELADDLASGELPPTQMTMQKEPEK